MRTASIMRVRLFITSYAPLALIFSVRFADASHWKTAAAFLVITAIGVFNGFNIINSAGRRARRRIRVEAVADQGSAVSGYLATYLLPFITELPSSWGDWVAYGLYFAVAIVIFIRSDLAIVNPTLYILGWRLGRATLDGSEVLMIMKEAVRNGDDVIVAQLHDVLVIQPDREGPCHDA